MSETLSDPADTLAFSCPRCGVRAEDEYEVLAPRVPTDWRCEGCGKPFNVLLMECDHCGAESAVVALAAPEQVPPAAVVCSSCGSHCIDHEEAGDEAC